MKRFFAALFIFTIILFKFSYSQDVPDKSGIKVLRGQISSLNWAGSSITVRYLQETGYIAYDEVTFFIPDKANIQKGTAQIGFTALHVGDQVSVEYLNASPGPLKVINMTVVSS